MTKQKKNFTEQETLLAELKTLTKNLWWAWDCETKAFFRDLSPQLWEQTHHNPSAMLVDMSKAELLARLGDRHSADRLRTIVKRFHAYLDEKHTWASVHAKSLKGPVAYFSAEFGLHESVRIYSGGLGILSGDHAKSASDLGIPFYGISLFYRQGYFEQRISVDGWQNEQYVGADPVKKPLVPVLDKNGKPLISSVSIGFSTVKFIAWRLQVGRGTIFLLDTDLPENEERYREITAHVYGGDSTTRISQEIVLGIGGVRLLRALGIHPTTFHMNEGHSAFLTVELLREQIVKKVQFAKALEYVKHHCVFTTHTPVPAGHDRFNKDLIEYTLKAQGEAMKLTVDELMSLGRIHPHDTNESLCMTVLALKMSRSANGVSELHGKVSREMWKELYPQKPAAKVPIGHITNGIHICTWMNPITSNFWKDKFGEKWNAHFQEPAFWEKAVDPKNLSDEELWALRYALRRSLIEYGRHTLYRQHARYGNGATVYESVLIPDALTIGFARRFATYKRAPLLFTNFERTLELFNDTKRPIQLLFAGKAHPRDDEGKKFIQRIVDLTKHPNLFGKVVFLENYDMDVARYLISGADLWLNNPRRPLEASGTSGQKICIHGGLNCSIMDGWWREAYDGTNGWSIGGDESPASYDVQDAQDSEHLYSVLKNKIIPEFYDRNADNLPVRWLKRVRRSIATLVPMYNTHRMVAEYVEKYYR